MQNDYDIILLDVMLPELNGFEVCQMIREKSDVPIIMLTAKGDDMDKILGLEYGADDYVTKPFNILEIKARIKAIIRRTKGRKQEQPAERTIVSGDMRIDLDSRRVFIGEREVNLTAKEFDLLLVPGSGFGAPGHVRIAYCVQTEMIERALPKFKALADSYRK